MRDTIFDMHGFKELDVIDWEKTNMNLKQVRDWLHAYAQKLHSHNRLQPPDVDSENLDTTTHPIFSYPHPPIIRRDCRDIHTYTHTHKATLQTRTQPISSCVE